MTLDIEKFNPVIADLQKLVEESKGIQVTDVTNEEQLKVSKKMRLRLRDARVAITKQGKAMREDALAFQKAVITRENEIVGIVEPEEERLQRFEDQAAEVAEIRRREALLPARKVKLDEIEDGIQALDDELLRMDDAAFTAYYNGRVGEKQRKAAADLKIREDAVKAEEEKQQREKDRLAAEERGRVQERERLEREAREKEEKQKREQEEKERKEREAKERAEREEKERIERERLEKERLEKEERYQMFLATNGWTEATKDDFIIHTTPQIITLFKKVGEFKK